MNLQKIFFILSIIGILILILLSQITTPTYTGTIESIQSSNNKITIRIENSSTELILFDTTYTNLKKGNTIEFQGRHDSYKDKEQIIIDKLNIIKS